MNAAVAAWILWYHVFFPWGAETWDIIAGHATSADCYAHRDAGIPGMEAFAIRMAKEYGKDAPHAALVCLPDTVNPRR